MTEEYSAVQISNILHLPNPHLNIRFFPNVDYSIGDYWHKDQYTGYKIYFFQSMNMTHNQYNELKSLLLDVKEMLTPIYAQVAQAELSPDEVCQWLGISRSTYQRKVEAGIIPQIKKGSAPNSPAFVRRIDIENLQKEGKV